MTLPWQADFYTTSPLFMPIAKAAQRFHACRDWPTLINMNEEFNVINYGHQAVQFVAQADKPRSFQEGYEQRIYLTGQVQTRLNNWHDFMNMLIWRTFPECKKIMNALHYHESLQPGQPTRTLRQHRLTQLDECGVIMLSSDPHLLDLLRQHAWHELFWNNRDVIENSLRCLILGHALYEKALQPYVGLTGVALLFAVTPEVINLSAPQLIDYADNLAANYIHHLDPTPKLTPLPLLGMPQWFKGNEHESFYFNREYFR
ncbi:MAG: DUF3025 domain-containing protein [Legionellales bacterium]|nr:DUF3025 domain-containing protein [Legionellales bacterium]